MPEAAVLREKENEREDADDPSGFPIPAAACAPGGVARRRPVWPSPQSIGSEFKFH